MAEGEQDGSESPKRWTAKRRAALALTLVRGETSVAELHCLRHPRGNDDDDDDAAGEWVLHAWAD